MMKTDKQKMREALEFYANRGNWDMVYGSHRMTCLATPLEESEHGYSLAERVLNEVDSDEED